jgi:hypothetical protein
MISIYDIMKSLKIPNQNPYIDGQKQHNGQKEKRPSTNTTQKT